MPDEPEPDFTFDAGAEPALDQLKPVYTKILSQGPKPKLSLGAVTQAVAEAWLVAAHRRYQQSVGQRSGLIQRMKLIDKVELVGLQADG